MDFSTMSFNSAGIIVLVTVVFFLHARFKANRERKANSRNFANSLSKALKDPMRVFTNEVYSFASKEKETHYFVEYYDGRIERVSKKEWQNFSKFMQQKEARFN